MNKEYRDVLIDSKKRKYSVCAFNVVNKITADAVIKAAEEVNIPVITQISYSVVKGLGIEATLEMLERARKDAKVPVIIHLDHCTDVEFTKECMRKGFQSVMYDGSHLSYEENLKNTREVVEYSKQYNCHVEGETGLISGVEDGVGSDYGKLASFDETMEYIQETGVDVIAPAIGTAHGIYKGVPNINYELVVRLTNEFDCPVAIHGGSGLSEDAYRKLVKCGGAKINISTALKHSYIDNIRILAAEDLPYNPLNFDKKLTEKLKEDMKKYILLMSEEVAHDV